MYSENGTNFVAYANELKEAYKEMDNEMIQFSMESLEQTEKWTEMRWIRNLSVTSQYCQPFFQHMENC